MGILNFFKKKEQLNKYELTDADRTQGLRIRELNQRIKETQKQIELTKKEAELNDLLEELREFEEDTIEDTPNENNNPESLLMSLITKAIINKQQQENSINTQPTTTQPTGINLSIEQMNSIYANLPKGIKKKISEATTEEIKSLLLKNYPNLNNVEETILFLKNRKV